MAERRMFAKTIIDSDAFLDMPLSAQALYFHLSMRADDDGFVNNPKRIQRVIGCNDDDYNVLVAKRFILTFESGIIVIKHWKIHNYIRQDRKKDTAYPEEMALLEEKDNGAYSFRQDLMVISSDDNNADIAVSLRQKAYNESTLPYSFDYKIRQAFYGRPCPVCGVPMRGLVDECGITNEAHRPTIQHNKPISKGGKHELGNISVICHKCNVSIQDTETEALNADEVIEVWDRLASDGQVAGKWLASGGVGEVSIGKDSKGKRSIKKFEPPTLEDVKAYAKSRGNKVDAQKFYDYYTAGNWIDVKGNPVKNWKQKMITWESKQPADKPNKFTDFNQRTYDYDALLDMTKH